MISKIINAKEKAEDGNFVYSSESEDDDDSSNTKIKFKRQESLEDMHYIYGEAPPAKHLSSLNLLNQNRDLYIDKRTREPIGTPDADSETETDSDNDHSSPRKKKPKLTSPTKQTQQKTTNPQVFLLTSSSFLSLPEWEPFTLPEDLIKNSDKEEMINSKKMRMKN